jgi:hypothetical protein
MFVLCVSIVLSCVSRGLCDGLDHSFKGVLPSVLIIRLRNLQCEAVKVLTRTVEPLMIMAMMMIMIIDITECIDLPPLCPRNFDSVAIRITLPDNHVSQKRQKAK